MDRYRIEDREALERALAAPSFLLFKHSPICPVSARAFREYRAFVEATPDVVHGWIDVVAERAWARAVAEATGIRHESPQALWLCAGKVAWHASHGGIVQSSLAAAAGA